MLSGASRNRPVIVGWSTALRGEVINESLGQLPKKLAAGRRVLARTESSRTQWGTKQGGSPHDRGSWVFSLDFSMCASRKISAPAFVSSNRAPPRLPSRGRYVGHRLRLYGWRFTTRDNLPAIGQARTPLIFQRAIVLAIPLHWRQGVDVSLSFRPVKRNLRHVDDGFLTS